jgi:hypothetical protein
MLLNTTDLLGMAKAKLISFLSKHSLPPCIQIAVTNTTVFPVTHGGHVRFNIRFSGETEPVEGVCMHMGRG